MFRRGLSRCVRWLPVVERELRIASRGQAAYRWRTLVVMVGLSLMALLTGSLAVDSTPGAAHGRQLFLALVSLAAVYAFVAGVTVTADTVSREKREGTLGLLFLTDLRGVDIVLGKLVANALHTVYGLIGLLPLLAIPILLGGVSIEAGFLAAVAVVNLMFVSVCIGIWISTLSWDERRATFAAIVTGMVLLVGPLLLGGLQVYFGRPSALARFVSSLSPLQPLLTATPALAIAGTSPVAGAPAVGGAAFALAEVGRIALGVIGRVLPSHLAGWAFLVAASRLASRVWQSRTGSARRTVDERLFTPRDPGARARWRRRLLEHHPLVWLLERHAGKRYYADGLVVAILIIWAWGQRTYGSDMFGGPSWFLVMPLAVVVHLIFASWVVAETSMRLLEDRRSGALELLLCTSLTDADLIRGHRLALRRLFLRPLLLLAAAEVFVAFTGFGSENDAAAQNGRAVMLAMALAVMLDTYALSWIALRLAVALPTVNRVSALALAITPLGPFLLAFVVGLPLSLLLQRHGGLAFGAWVLAWVFCVLLVDLGVGVLWCRRAVRRKFREAAARVQPRAAVAG